MEVNCILYWYSLALVAYVWKSIQICKRLMKNFSSETSRPDLKNNTARETTVHHYFLN